MGKEYPKWIDEYAKSVHNAFINMMPGNWGPLDFFEFFRCSNGTFLNKISQAVKAVKTKNYSKKEIAESFSSPSALRCAFLFLVLEYLYSKPKDKKQFKEIAEFFVEILDYIMKKDMFSCHSNIVHSEEEIKNILNTIPWIAADPQTTRELGKLYNSANSLAYSLYRDFFPQDSLEIYGPYNASKKFGDDTILLIKHFSKLLPKELWPDINYEYKDIKIYQVFKNVKFKCELIGMHSIYDGDIINNTKFIAIKINNKFIKTDDIKKISQKLAEITTKQIQVYDSMSLEQIKYKTLEWECYQFINFFKLADMDWKPTEGMIEAVKDKNIGDRCILEEFPSTLDEFVKSTDHEVYWLKDLYK